MEQKGLTLSSEQIKSFHDNGFLILDKFLTNDFANKILSRYELLFKGNFDTGNYPDEWHYREGMSLPDITREICNAWKCDLTIASLVLSEEIGRLCAQLGGWDGTRLSQDDIWWKPCGGKPTIYHQDSAYIPWPQISCWIALDDTRTTGNDNVGTLEFARASHKWPIVKNDKVEGFFNPLGDFRDGMLRAASVAGIQNPEIVQVKVPVGGCSFHNEDVWHGSPANNMTTRMRRSIGIHTINCDSKYPKKDEYNGGVGYIYGRYKLANSDVMEESFYPIIYSKNGYRTPFLSTFCKDALK